MDALTKSSVAAVLKRIMSLASRPLTEFNKHEALELVDSLKNSAHDAKHEKEHYYRLVYETLRSKLDRSDQQFRDLLLPLLGDKDYEKVLDVVTKVEKRNVRANQNAPSSQPAQRSLASNPALRCFYCGRVGHFQSQCRKRKREEELQPSTITSQTPQDSRLQQRN